MTKHTTLFKAEWGSRAYGTNTEHSDRDLIQVIIEPPPYITGLLEFRANHQSTAEQGERSTKDDTDVVIYGLKKYAGLAVDGNPQVMATLWLKEFIEFNPLFALLQDNRALCVSKNSGRKYLGYMRSQKGQLTGLTKRATNRPELIHTHGWDTKFGMHAVRLGYQGLELMTTGQIKLPMEGVALETCQAIRRGEWTKERGLELMDSLEADLERTIETSDWPERGYRDAISTIMHDIYRETWNAQPPLA